MGSMEELYTVTVRDNQLPCSTVQVCFGLVCLSTNCRIYLCNPAMQQLCELPKYSPSITPGYDHFGFGYLQSRKEYKVVHFFYRVLSMDVKWCPLSDLLFAQIKCEVLTINKRPQPARDIISFDLENEKFLTISYPSSFESIHGQNLMDLKGMLCLPDEGRFRRSSILDLWILKDKISCTWVKEYSIALIWSTLGLG
ncbi:hypothetical protein CQW23_15464 [Capsicum baccatum]|uniref:F-box associated beta-propeller type 3 domain-containing protein n=1 Tax=Capsicum baccatum TaxID=33114 RepID=A0A2G2WM45_CAPBA|nr:hypothetical protein CQW23_15464 [Capsicum baccatum]